jgi:serine protease Do
MASAVLDQIIKTGKVVRGWLGVSIQEVSPEIAELFNIKNTQGAVISDVSSGSPADKAGLQRGDVITQLSGEPIQGSRELRLKVARLAPGTNIRLSIVRNGEQRDLNVTLGEAPAEKIATAGGVPSAQENQRLQGAELQTLTPSVARQLGLPAETHGIVVRSVDPGSTAAEAGLRPRDVIQEINRKPVQNVEELNRFIREAGDRPVVLLVNREGTTLFLVVKNRP